MTKEEATKVLMEERLYEIEHEGDSPKGEALKMAISALRAQQEPNPYKFSPIDKYKGLKRKYVVLKADTGEVVENCFVLRPDKDPSAVAALRTYAESTDNKTLSKDIINWVGAESNDPLTLEELRQMDGEPVWVVCDEEAVNTTPGFEPLAFWTLVEVCEESIFLTNNLGGRTEYATDVELEEDGIAAYRRRPEED